MKIAVLGGGLAGLYYIYKSIQSGSKDEFVLIEKEKTFGGLCKTYGYEGHFFDIGGHRFMSNNKSVEETFRQLVGDDILTIDRMSKIYYNDKFIPYPINIESLHSVANKEKVKIALELFKKPKGEDLNYEDFVVRRFGKTLFELFFKDYTQKVVGLECNEIDKDWGENRINFDKKSMFKKLAGVDKGDRFLYPSQGINVIINNMLLKMIKNYNCRLMKKSTIEEIVVDTDSNEITSISIDGESINVDRVVSTIPIDSLSEYLGVSTSITYRSLILIIIVLEDQYSKNHWIYFPEKKFKIGRIHEPGNWSEKMKGQAGYPLCMEIFCEKNDETWMKSDADIIEEANVAFFGEVKCSKVVRIENAYPNLKLGYREDLNQVMDKLSKISNLELIGRTGRFEYINMDQVLENIDKIFLKE